MKKTVLFVLLFSLSAFALPPDSKNTTYNSLAVDNSTYINANKVFMFITNHGNFGRDLAGMIGYDAGTFYPFENMYDLENHINVKSPLYGAGIWVGGKVNDSIRVSISEYSSEFVPGPMLNGTFQTDSDAFKVYKLHYDSLADNPNDDYLNWPVDQGAPVDSLGNPLLKGNQTLWSVFNDANPAQHTNINSEPLGIEIQQTTYAQYETGVDTVLYPEHIAIVSGGKVKGDIIDFSQLTTDEYMVVLNYNDTTGHSWSLINNTTGELLFENQTTDTSDVIDGFRLALSFSRSEEHYFEAIANGAGVLDPVESAGAPWYGYPVPTEADPDGYITSNQQVGEGMWMIATGDNGGSSGGGDRGRIDAFYERTFRDFESTERFAGYGWEIRFTGANDNPGVGGGYAVNAFTDNLAYWVPFELWRVNPDNSNEDLRLIPWLYGDDDSTFDISSYGSDADGNCGPWGCEHSISGGDNDPYTDLFYWKLPADGSGNEVTTFGDSAYQVFEDSAIADPSMANWQFNELPVMDRMVLVNWNGGIQPPFNQALPEQGSIFSISPSFDYTPDTITFVPPQAIQTNYSPEHTSIYIEYKLYNKSTNFIDSCYISFWTDPDLGDAGDDFVGCDTLTDIYYCYNANDVDRQYGVAPPAIGIKFLHGPIVPSIGETAIFGNDTLQDCTNLKMSSFIKFVQGLDARNSTEAFNFMKGLSISGSPYIYNNSITPFHLTGDPVQGTGDLDFASSDRQVMASVGPFDFAPGDSQYVKIKMAIGQGSDRLSSISIMKEILNAPEKLDLIPEPWPPIKVLPTSFTISQNYPNPFNPSTRIEYDVPKPSHVTIEIYNILGRKVKTLVNKHHIANNYFVEWDGTNSAGASLATGLYFYRITTDNFSESKKMLLLK